MASKDGIRADWKDSKTVKFLLDIYLEQVSIWEKYGASLRKESWDAIVKEFEDKKGLKLTQKQLKNQWNYMRHKYNVWSSLVSKSGHGYDHVTHTVSWSKEQWDSYIQMVPDAKQFQVAGLQYTDEMKTLFDGISATGKEAWGLSRSEIQNELSLDTRQTLDNFVEPTEVSSENVKLGCSTSEHLHAEKRRKKNKSIDIDGQIMAVLKTLENFEGPTLQECNQKLAEMTTLKEVDVEYVAASCIFCEGKSYREQWIELSSKPEGVRIGWIRMIAKNLGFL